MSAEGIVVCNCRAVTGGEARRGDVMRRDARGGYNGSSIEGTAGVGSNQRKGNAGYGWCVIRILSKMVICLMDINVVEKNYKDGVY